MRLSMATYHFDTEEAQQYGVDCAVLLYNLRFWIMKNKANRKNFKDGRTWTYNSARAFTELFPFWNERKIGRLLNKLEERGAIVSANYNKAGYDKTKWYALTNEEDAFDKNGKGSDNSDRPIPDINTDNKPDNIVANAPEAEEKNHPTPQPSPSLPKNNLCSAKREALELWLQYKKEKRQGYKPTGLAALIKKWEGHTAQQVVEAVGVAMANGWSGCFPEKVQVKHIPSQGVRC